MRRQLRQRGRHPDGESLRTFGAKAVDGLRQLTPLLEDLIRVAKHGFANLGQREVAATTHEQLVPERSFERVQLRADGRLREVQLVGCSDDATLAHDSPEVQ